jgi:hypothetical protein
MNISRNIPGAGVRLEYPMSLGVCYGYPQAQHVVDYLADHDFPVQNVEIVGTELRSIERITGQLTRGRTCGDWLVMRRGMARSGASARSQLGLPLSRVR